MNNTQKRKMFIGIVTSNKMQKTIVVKVSRKVLHKLYKKYIVYSKKLKAHDENNEAKIGDTVEIIECRPISKDKHCRLNKILKVRGE